MQVIFSKDWAAPQPSIFVFPEPSLTQAPPYLTVHEFSSPMKDSRFPSLPESPSLYPDPICRQGRFNPSSHWGGFHSAWRWLG